MKLIKRVLLSFCLVGLIFAASGCGSSSSSSSSASATTAAPGSGTAITIKDFKFSPATLSVKVGATVTVTNQDTAAHTVTAIDKSFDTGSLKQGESKTITLSKVGTFNYDCTFHNYMTGVIQVTQ